MNASSSGSGRNTSRPVDRGWPAAGVHSNRNRSSSWVSPARAAAARRHRTAWLTSALARQAFGKRSS